MSLASQESVYRCDCHHHNLLFERKLTVLSLAQFCMCDKNPVSLSLVFSLEMVKIIIACFTYDHVKSTSASLCYVYHTLCTG